MHHPAPWWYRLATRLIPDRCREIPEAVNPSRIVLRQVAIWKRHAYLQQFAISEDPRYMHSHQWRRMFAIGLWGGYREMRIAGRPRYRAAPYFYTMDDSVVHQAQVPSPGHTSLFVGLGRDDDLKYYYDALTRTHWAEHIRKKVKRI
jgi:hypothetical protein